MCQLSLITTNDRRSTYLLAVNLMMENSRLANKDGCGVFTPTIGVKKSEIAASNLLNLGEVLLGSAKKDSEPMLCHVRAASFSTANKKLLSKEHAHPFESEHFVFAHNGTLTFKDKTNEDFYKDKEVIDSEIFLQELEKRYTGDIVKDVNAAMDLFTGKFAFIMWHKPEKTFYIIRGRTATLYQFKLINPITKEVIGTVINTESSSFSDACIRASNSAQLLGIRFDSEKAELLSVETAFKLEGNELIKIGEVKENEKPITYSNFTERGSTERKKYGTDTYGFIVDMMIKWGLGPIDMDELIYHLFKRPAMDMMYADRDKIKNLLELLDKEFEISNCKHRWERMNGSRYFGKLYGMFPSLQFPYFLTKKEEFNKIYQDFLDTEKMDEDKEKEEREKKKHESNNL